MIGSPLAEPSGVHWLIALRRYFSVIAVGNLIWETAHMPLYTLWSDGTWSEIAFAVVHCTGGDLLISMASLVLALLLSGDGSWPKRAALRVGALTIAFGVCYTIFSEWLNIVVRKSWAYSSLMPIIPLIDTGLSPVAQWFVIPLAAFWWVRAAYYSHRH